MRWERRGKICGRDTWDLSWHKLNTQLPIPYLVDKNTLRLYITMCDSSNRGRFGYVDVNPENPSEIIGYSKQPLIDLGNRGCFDEDGVVVTCLFEHADKMYAYYCGYQRQVHFPYSSLTGLAISDDKGKSFYRVKEAPLLERKDGEMFIRTGAGVYKYGDVFRIVYASGNEWFNDNGKWFPKYRLKYIDSQCLDEFSGKSTDMFPLDNDEFGMTSPQVWKEDGLWKMVYSIRSVSKGYRMGYAFSRDGRYFIRDDRKMNIELPKEGFDSEMICYGKCFRYGDKTYLFYSGNHYGMAGIGWAEGVKE